MFRLQLVAANYEPEMISVYENLGLWAANRGLEFVLAQCTTEDEAIEKAKDADIYLAWKFPVTRRVIASLPKLKLIMASGSGYDHIDVQAATAHGVVVANAANHNIEDVAEHTLVLILACGRKIRFLESLSRQNCWLAGASVKLVCVVKPRIMVILFWGERGWHYGFR